MLKSKKGRNGKNNSKSNGAERIDFKPFGKIVPLLEDRGFCASLLSNGNTMHLESRNVEEFIPLINSANISWLDYIVDDLKTQAHYIGSTFGFSEELIIEMLKVKKRAYEDFEKEMGFVLPAILVKGFDVRINPIIILIKKNLVLTIHTSEVKRFFLIRKYAETFMRKLSANIPVNDKTTILLIRIANENNGRNFEHLREIEEYGDKLSKELADPKAPREIIGGKIYHMKHALITYLGGLWSTFDTLNVLRYGDADLLTDDENILNKLNGLINEVSAQIGLAEHLSEVLASGLEVLQSIYNNQLQILNNRLALMIAYLTIIGTALLVPNTIATVAGNNMFGFTAKDADWYLPLIVVSTIVATIVSWLVVKKMQLLPSRPDVPDDIK